MSGSEKRRRDREVNVRLTKGELSDLDRAAHAMGISVAELLRDSFASGSPIAVRTQHARAIYNEGHSKGLVEGAEAIRALADELRAHAAAERPEDDRWDDGWRAAHRKIDARLRAALGDTPKD